MSNSSTKPVTTGGSMQASQRKAAPSDIVMVIQDLQPGNQCGQFLSGLSGSRPGLGA